METQYQVNTHLSIYVSTNGNVNKIIGNLQILK